MGPKTTQLTELDILRAENYKCTRCENRKKCTQVTIGFGSLTPKVVIVGDKPSTEEEQTGKPFQGRAGILLRSLVSDAYMTYLVKCNGNLNKYKDCVGWLDKELEIIKPQKIIAFGRASNYLLGRPLTKPPLIGVHDNILVWYHPTYLLRNYKLIEESRQVFKDFL